MGNRQAGAELFLRALEVDPNYNYCLRSYAKLLYAGNENVELAELLYARARQCQLDRGEPAHKNDQ
jgi:lipoprotein NlpI